MKHSVEARAYRLWRMRERRYWPNQRIPVDYGPSDFQRDMTRADVAVRDAMRAMARSLREMLAGLSRLAVAVSRRGR